MLRRKNEANAAGTELLFNNNFNNITFTVDSGATDHNINKS